MRRRKWQLETFLVDFILEMAFAPKVTSTFYFQLKRNNFIHSLGRYCEFLHQNDRPLCKFYFSSVGCQKGNNCTFLHKKPKQNIPNKPQVIIKPLNDLTEVSAPINSLEALNSQTSVSQSINEMWGMNNSEEGYFYGSAGSMKPLNENRQYVDALRRSLHSSYTETGNLYYYPTENYPNHQSLPITKQIICPFYIYGSCMYGSDCKNIHRLNDSNTEEFSADEEQLTINTEIANAKTAECGICLSPIENKSLGMLSNCWCTFCLDCIRSWRKEGLAIVRQVIFFKYFLFILVSN